MIETLKHTIIRGTMEKGLKISELIFGPTQSILNQGMYGLDIKAFLLDRTLH